MSRVATAAQPQVINLCDDDDDEAPDDVVNVARLATPTRVMADDNHDYESEATPRRYDEHMPAPHRQERKKLKKRTLGKENKRTAAALPASKKRAVKKIRRGASLKDPPASAAAAMPPYASSPTGVARVDVDANESDDSIEVAKVVPPPRTPLDDVMEVFPDVQREHAQSLLQQHSGNVATVVSLLADTSYPKSKTAASAHAPGLEDGVVLHRDKRKREYTYDFSSASSFEPTEEYTLQAREQLRCDFPFIGKNGSKNLLNKEGKGHYAICYEAICRGVMGGTLSKDGDEQEEQYRLLKKSLSGVPLTAQQHARLMHGKRRTTILSPRKNPMEVVVTNEVLLEEIGYVQHKQAEWMEEVNLRMARKQNRAAAEKAGATWECPCCCFDVAVDEMIACHEEGHLFCVDCLRRFAENQIFNMNSFGIDPKTKKPATDLMCMHSDGCSSGFDIEHLRKALPERIMTKYNELQYQAAVGAAGIDLFSCPKCGIQAELPPTQMIFKCPDADCAQETCRQCNEPAHIPLKCSEVEKKHETEGRLKVEEAISAAKIRTCPNPGCGKKFIKEDGCNKMTCPSCGSWSCYICRTLVAKNVGYKHFCQTPHCQHESCSQCPLYSKVEDDDKRAMREAGIQAAEEVRGDSLLAEGTSAAPSEVRVDVESLLKDAPVPLQRGLSRR